jgi:hypothetical protein
MGKKGFTPPTIEEVIEYCASRNNMVDPYKFFDFYDVSGWIDSNGKPVKNWKQKVITWEGRNGSKQFYPNAQNSAATGKTKSKFHYDNA